MEAMNSFGEIQGPSHFFKVILSSTLETKMLGIPEKFVLKFGDELSAVATLTVPNGCVWQVGLKKEGKEIWFDEGWHDFVEHHSIAVGHLLVFKYGKGSNFRVLIFDMSACEVEYPYNNGVSDNEKENLVHENETADVHSVEMVDQRINHQDFYGFLEDMGICISEACRCFTVEERQRALLAARLFKPTNHSFLVMLRAIELKKQYVYVPSKFYRKYFSREVKRIYIQDCDGAEWPVSIKRPRRGCLIQGGWYKFLQEKDLEEGDICVFELIRNNEIVLKVSVHKI